MIIHMSCIGGFCVSSKEMKGKESNIWEGREMSNDLTIAFVISMVGEFFLFPLLIGLIVTTHRVVENGVRLK